MEVDFPQKKKQAAELKEKNESLMKQFKVDGFPTLIALDSEGKNLGAVAYPEDTKALIASLDKLRKK
jgi:thioredoxin-related protein